MGSFSVATVLDWWMDNALRSLLLAVAAGLLLFVLRIRDANVQHRTWIVVLVTMMVLPALCLMLPDVVSPIRLPAIGGADMETVLIQRRSDPVNPTVVAAGVPNSAVLPIVVDQSAPPNPIEELETTPVASKPVSWTTIAVVVYMAVAFALLTRILIGIVLTGRMVRRGRRLTAADHAAFSGELFIVESHEVRTPATVGIRHPVTLLPSDWRTWNTETLQMAIAHESFHIQRRDALVSLVANMNVALYWLNPLSWFLRWRLADLAEQVCDDEVLRVHGDHAGYAETLLAMAARVSNSQRVSPLVVPMARKAQVETRIEAIIDDERPLCQRLGWRGVAMLLTIAVPLIASIAALQPAGTVEAEEAEATENSLTEYTITYDVAGAAAKYTELLDHLRGLSEFRVTSYNDDQIVVTARRSVHKRIDDFLTNLPNLLKGTSNNIPRPIIYPELTEKLSDGLYKFSFLVPWVRAVDDPARRANTEALIKSDMLLSRAVKGMDFLGDIQPSVMEYLRKDLSIHYSSGGHMFVALIGAENGEASVAAYVAPIINEYLVEHLTHLARNQHDLATENVRLDLANTDVRPVTSETTNDTNTASRQRERPEVNTENPFFPTLEEQRAVDLAYKLLGVEVEKLTPEELQRVKAKGYKGGLRIARVSGRQTIQDDLGSGDLLVGLHVWPTESLIQIREILVRYDMPDFTPLKYYVIRPTAQETESGLNISGSQRPMVDQVITGRIEVDLDAWAEKEGFKRERLKSMREWQSKGASSAESPFAPGSEDSNEESPFDFGGEDSDPLYDGKTFDDWRQQLQSELNPEKRIECIDALVAFSRAGKGEAAADVLLAVAGEFDWKNRRGEPLQEKCLMAFYSLNSRVALKAVLKAADSENEQIKWFAELVALNLGRTDNEFRTKLKEKFPYLEFSSSSRGGGGMGGGYGIVRAQSDEPSRKSDLPRHPKALDVSIGPFNEKPLEGSRNTYTLFIANTTDAPMENVELVVTFPPELVPDMATIKAPVAAELVGNEIKFSPLAVMRANERVGFTITASVLKAGEGEIIAKIKSKDSPENEVRQAVHVVDQ